MELVRAEVLGYCAGVRRAIEQTEKLLADGHFEVFTFGTLIHNEQVLRGLCKRGVQIADESDFERISRTKNACVVVRAHGVPPETMRNLRKTGAKIIDATCARVQKSQKTAGELAKKGFSIIIAGEKNHAEIKGIFACAKENFAQPNQVCLVVENVGEAESLPFLPQKAALISQTTISAEEFENISACLQKKISDLQICNMICPATRERQKSLEKLCSQCRAVVVIGGKNSANAKRLFLTAKSLNANAFFIESAAEIPDEILQFEKIGITAGASTPETAIAAVEKAISAKFSLKS